MPKLSKKKGGSGSTSYSIAISKKEVETLGLLDEQGVSKEVVKIVDLENRQLIIKEMK